MHHIRAIFIWTLSPFFLPACVLSTSTLGENINMKTPEQQVCRAKISQPAIYETVIEKIQTAPPKFSPTGRQIAPATYQNRVTQRVLRERDVEWFDTPCKDEVNADLIANLQRALAARGYFNGTITAMMDPDTSAALQRYQAENGLDTATLARQTVEDFGLLPMRQGSEDDR